MGVDRGREKVCPLCKKGPFYRWVSTLLSLIVAYPCSLFSAWSCPSNEELLKDCLKVKKDKGFKFLWTNGGKVFMRKV